MMCAVRDAQSADADRRRLVAPRSDARARRTAYASGIALMMSESPGSVMDMQDTR
jgi:hypothetical protein